MEEFTAQKEARIRQMGAEILTVDPTYRATPTGAEDAGQIVSTTRNADAAAQLLGMQPEQLLKEMQDAAAKPAQEQGMRLHARYTTPTLLCTLCTIVQRSLQKAQIAAHQCRG